MSQSYKEKAKASSCIALRCLKRAPNNPVKAAKPHSTGKARKTPATMTTGGQQSPLGRNSFPATITVSTKCGQGVVLRISALLPRRSRQLPFQSRAQSRVEIGLENSRNLGVASPPFVWAPYPRTAYLPLCGFPESWQMRNGRGKALQSGLYWVPFLAVIRVEICH